MPKKPNSRKDEIELAKSIFDEIVEETESEDWDKSINKIAQKGGISRAAKLSDVRKTEIAKKAADARWRKYYDEKNKE